MLALCWSCIQRVIEPVVVVGLGLVSPLGIGVSQTWRNIELGIVPVDYVVKLDTSPAEDRSLGFARIALNEALQHIPSELISSAAMMISNSKYGMDYFYRYVVKHGLSSHGYPVDFLHHVLPEFVGHQLAVERHMTGIVKNYAAACATGLLSIIEATRLIQFQGADLVIAGATEASKNPFIEAAFAKMGVLTADKIRPFSLARSGFRIGEGCGVVVLASYQFAKKQGLPRLARIVSYHLNNQLHHFTAFESSGHAIATNIRMNLQKAGVSCVDFINCHGTATLQNDLAETLAIKSVFGNRAYDVPISATKPMTGHLLGATSAVEFILSVLALQHQTLLPTWNLEESDPALDLDYIPHLRRARISRFLTNNYGFGGHIVGAIVEKVEDLSSD